MLAPRSAATNSQCTPNGFFRPQSWLLPRPAPSGMPPSGATHMNANGGVVLCCSAQSVVSLQCTLHTCAIVADGLELVAWYLIRHYCWGSGGRQGLHPAEHIAGVAVLGDVLLHGSRLAVHEAAGPAVEAAHVRAPIVPAAHRRRLNQVLPAQMIPSRGSCRKATAV
jgi:hypothetical protein